MVFAQFGNGSAPTANCKVLRGRRQSENITMLSATTIFSLLCISEREQKDCISYDVGLRLAKINFMSLFDNKISEFLAKF